MDKAAVCKTVLRGFNSRLPLVKIKNLNIYNKTPEQLRALKEEYELIGFATKLYDDKLVVFALPPKKEKKKDDKRKKNSSHTSGRRDQARKVEKVHG